MTCLNPQVWANIVIINYFTTKSKLTELERILQSESLMYDKEWKKIGFFIFKDDKNVHVFEAETADKCVLNFEG